MQLSPEHRSHASGGRATCVLGTNHTLRTLGDSYGDVRRQRGRGRCQGRVLHCVVLCCCFVLSCLLVWFEGCRSRVGVRVRVVGLDWPLIDFKNGTSPSQICSSIFLAAHRSNQKMSDVDSVNVFLPDLWATHAKFFPNKGPGLGLGLVRLRDS